MHSPRSIKRSFHIKKYINKNLIKETVLSLFIQEAGESSGKAGLNYEGIKDKNNPLRQDKNRIDIIHFLDELHSSI